MPNINIRKDGEDWQIDVDKLRVPKTEGGSEDWVETGDKKLVKLTAGENGTYKASDYGAYGFSEVEVLQSGLKAKTKDAKKKSMNAHGTAITEGGKKRPMTAKNIVVKSGANTTKLCAENDLRLRTLYTSNAGTFKPGYGYYGFSEASVSFPSGGASGRDGGWSGANGGNGLPESIVITVLPNKTQYVNGEEIDYSGLQVKAYDADGNIWKNEDYPDGVIPENELILDYTVADSTAGAVTSELLNDYTMDKVLQVNYINYIVHRLNPDSMPDGEEETLEIHDTEAYMKSAFLWNVIETGDRKCGVFVLLTASDNLSSEGVYRQMNYDLTYKLFQVRDDGAILVHNSGKYQNQYLQLKNKSLSFTYKGGTVYYNWYVRGYPAKIAVNLIDYSDGMNFDFDLDKTTLLALLNAKRSEHIGKIAWTMVYGNHVLPIKWERPGDRAILETTLEIAITT